MIFDDLRGFPLLFRNGLLVLGSHILFYNSRTSSNHIFLNNYNIYVLLVRTVFDYVSRITF